MKQNYIKYKGEILAGIGILVSIFIAILGPNLTTNVCITHFAQYWYFYTIAFLTIYLIHQMIKKREIPLNKFKTGGDPDFIATLNLVFSTYFYMGMSAEEFLRDVDIEKYFIKRKKNENPIKKLRFLFLHPDSDNFKQRLLDVNPERDIESLIKSKKGYLQTLHLSLDSLPKEAIESGYEIRYYTGKPIWLLQFYDSEQSYRNNSSLKGVIVSIHIPNVHSKYSTQWICEKHEQNYLFESFLEYFETIWDQSIPATEAGVFPEI